DLMNNSLDRIDQMLETLEAELDKYPELVEMKAKTEATYKSLKAKAMLESKTNKTLKTVGDREAYVADKLENEYYDYILAEAKLDTHKERVRTLRSMLSALQTLSSAGRV